jgi:hypothetical protein
MISFSFKTVFRNFKKWRKKVFTFPRIGRSGILVDLGGKDKESANNFPQSCIFK